MDRLTAVLRNDPSQSDLFLFNISAGQPVSRRRGLFPLVVGRGDLNETTLVAVIPARASGVMPDDGLEQKSEGGHKAQ